MRQYRNAVVVQGTIVELKKSVLKYNLPVVRFKVRVQISHGKGQNMDVKILRIPCVAYGKTADSMDRIRENDWVLIYGSIGDVKGVMELIANTVELVSAVKDTERVGLEVYECPESIKKQF